jgi:hypothetical protein
LAVRAGLFRRPPHQDRDLFENEAKSLPKQGHAHRSTHGFSNISNSTQEDLNLELIYTEMADLNHKPWMIRM